MTFCRVGKCLTGNVPFSQFVYVSRDGTWMVKKKIPDKKLPGFPPDLLIHAFKTSQKMEFVFCLLVLGISLSSAEAIGGRK